MCVGTQAAHAAVRAHQIEEDLLRFGVQLVLRVAPQVAQRGYVRPRYLPPRVRLAVGTVASVALLPPFLLAGEVAHVPTLEAPPRLACPKAEAVDDEHRTRPPHCLGVDGASFGPPPREAGRLRVARRVLAHIHRVGDAPLAAPARLIRLLVCQHVRRRRHDSWRRRAAGRRELHHPTHAGRRRAAAASSVSERRAICSLAE